VNFIEIVHPTSTLGLLLFIVQFSLSVAVYLQCNRRCANISTRRERQPACKPEYKMAPSSRPDFRTAPQVRQPTASPAITAVVGQVRVGQKAHRWRSPPELTLSPSREVARTSRRAELSSALRHWARKHPGKIGLRGTGHGPAVIPLESTPPRGYRLASAAAGSARDLAPASPDPEEAY